MSTKAKVRNVIRGLVLIAAAVCLLLSRSSYFSDYPMIKITISIIMALLFGQQLIEKSFLGMSIPLGVITCLYKTELGLGDIHYAIVMLAFILLGLGLSIIFGRKTMMNFVGKGHGRSMDYAGESEYWEQDGIFEIDNKLGARTQYVEVQNIRKGTIDNALGSMSVYFNGSTVDANGAVLDIDNGMGSLKIYFPKEFRVSFKCDNGMGTINMHGECSDDPDQPLITADVDNGMGTIDFYFE